MWLVFGQWIIDSWVGGSALPIFGHCLINEFGQRSTLPWLKQRNILFNFSHPLLYHVLSATILLMTICRTRLSCDNVISCGSQRH